MTVEKGLTVIILVIALILVLTYKVISGFEPVTLEFEAFSSSATIH